MQLHGYLHSSNPDEFPLNKDDHSHTHEDMDAARSPLKDYQKRFDMEMGDMEMGKQDSEGSNERISEEAEEKADAQPHRHGSGEAHVH